MSFTQLTTTQKQFLEQYLRGTGKSLTARQAAATFGIKNLRARMTEMRKAGLKVKTDTNASGRTQYSISARDAQGQRRQLFAAR